MTMAWMAEVGGILSSVLSPYFGRDSIYTEINPFILENLYQATYLLSATVPTAWRETPFIGKGFRGLQTLTGESLLKPGTPWTQTEEQTLSLKSAGEKIVKRTVGLWSDYSKKLEYRDNPVNRKFKESDTRYYDWLESIGKSKTGSFVRTEQNMYYRELKKFFLQNDAAFLHEIGLNRKTNPKEEFARVFTTLSYHMFDKYMEDWRNEEEAWKQTIRQMKSYLKALSPIRASAEHNDFISSRRTRYLASLPEKDRKELISFENQIKYRLNEYLDYTMDFWDEYQIKDLNKKYKFKRRYAYELLK
jgi:hypothetical protein